MNLTNLADIRALLARHDFRFSKSLGQNFLTAAGVPADIADASGADVPPRQQLGLQHLKHIPGNAQRGDLGPDLADDLPDGGIGETPPIAHCPVDFVVGDIQRIQRRLTPL